ncbi:creatinase-like [Amphiura filiformis]|uniref:creatinase-like n=1 Tax=Amphiura filiformis TaxID=82378 RepID=UPI003B222D1D
MATGSGMMLLPLFKALGRVNSLHVGLRKFRRTGLGAYCFTTRQYSYRPQKLESSVNGSTTSTAMAHLTKIENGQKIEPTFSKQEMDNRLATLRDYMQTNGVEGVLFTSYHNINYYSDFLYLSMGRPYGLAVTMDKVTTISALVDWGHPWRRAHICDNVVYTDWHKDNFWRAVAQELAPSRSKVACEFDTMSVDNMNKFKLAVPDRDIVDIAEPIMMKRIKKSDEEIALIKSIAAISDVGGAAIVEAMDEGVPEYVVRDYAIDKMNEEIARKHPNSEFRDTWAWWQTGPVNTDGAHNPVTTRRLQKGDICIMNLFPIVSGYYAALERTAFLDHVPDEHLRLWNINCEIHRKGIQLIKAGVKCQDIALELNEIFAKYNLLETRSFGYGHSIGTLTHYYGREAALELREDVETVLEPNMCITMEPMIVMPIGQPGEGGYREHNIHIVTETGNEDITGFPFGPEHLVVKK